MPTTKKHTPSINPAARARAESATLELLRALRAGNRAAQTLIENDTWMCLSARTSEGHEFLSKADRKLLREASPAIVAGVNLVLTRMGMISGAQSASYTKPSED